MARLGCCARSAGQPSETSDDVWKSGGHRRLSEMNLGLVAGGTKNSRPVAHRQRSL